MSRTALNPRSPTGPTGKWLRQQRAVGTCSVVDHGVGDDDHQTLCWRRRIRERRCDNGSGGHLQLQRCSTGSAPWQAAPEQPRRCGQAHGLGAAYQVGAGGQAHRQQAAGEETPQVGRQHARHTAGRQRQLLWRLETMEEHG